MSKITKVLSVCFVFAFVVCGVSFAKDFSADFVSKAGQALIRGKMFFANNKFRMENPQAITISRMDKKVVFVLMPGQKMYMEQPITEENTKGLSQKKMAGEMKREKIGNETVNGIKADKYRITYKAQGKTDSMFQWIASGIEMPVKTSSVDGKWSMELKNVKFGSQPDALFEVPKGYKKFSYKMPSF
ncbi:MAG: DUF4412 domain-containing protein [Candidatus Margulisiibacteriota bacterium]